MNGQMSQCGYTCYLRSMEQTNVEAKIAKSKGIDRTLLDSD